MEAEGLTVYPQEWWLERAHTFGQAPGMPLVAPTAEVDALVEQARQLANVDRNEAESAFQAILELWPDCPEANSFLGDRRFRAQRYAEAAELYARCVSRMSNDPMLQFNLALAHELSGNIQSAIPPYLRAFRLAPKDARIALYLCAALVAVGRLQDAAVIATLADDANPGIRGLKDRTDVSPDIRARGSTLDRVMRESLTRLHVQSMEDFERLLRERGEKDVDLSRVKRAIWVQTSAAPFKYLTPRQEPSIFYMADLAARATTPRAALPWAAQIEAATDAIRAEYVAAQRSGAKMSPYVDAGTRDPIWQQLRGNMDWSSLHLYKAARQMPAARLFPETLRALEAADVVRVEGATPIEMFFSRMKPGTHIPPHFGAVNSRLTVHLPLIVPDGCEIRVGDEVHHWSEGELLAFDDSFEHEAWNHSDVDRVVLIFESHRPDLGAQERQAIEYAFQTRGRWLQARRIPD